MQLKENEIKSIDLFITEQCNMDCSYCFHAKRDEVLSLEQGRKILERMKQISPEALQITFFGGEPLLYPQTVLELAKYARQLWPDKDRVHTSTFSVSTNGTYFDEEMFKQYKELGFSMQVSCDGDEITTAEYRKGDWKLVTENIKKMLVIFPDLSVRLTYTPKTAGRLSINVQFLHQELGVKRITHHAVMEDDWTPEAVEKYVYQLNQLYHYRRYCLRQSIPLEIAFIDKPLKTINDEVPPDSNYCEAGKSYLAVLASGDVYPCHRAASVRVFKLGNIFEERPFIRGMFLSINKEYTGCWKNCFAAVTCHSCVITHYKVNGELTQPVAKYCQLCKAEYNQALKFLPVELSDRRERMIYKIAQVLVDVARQNEEVLAELRKERAS
jgi:uncharacterized protein